MRKGKLDAHLGYDKHDKTASVNARNGFSNKILKHLLVSQKYKFPETGRLHLILSLQLRQSIICGLENVIVSPCANGITVSDIEQQIKEVFHFDISTTNTVYVYSIVLRRGGTLSLHCTMNKL